MAHSKAAHGSKNAMGQFNEGHHTKNMSQLDVCGLKYTEGEMQNPEHLLASNNALATYAKKHKAKH